eukprot:CAMPEP_0170271852 /NCGR_PEP_ID=MMETSP0116_2-20130129/35876_1 /TAXON_ID=400756 /ORGANISM="Durinskia baltica, Strain CSIRO CS-38" /LENGTH=392 /DNA_ID=CAMNT_0010523055 /DNA_START=335 /DNA_END=1509 /DNA_ORIENTATION=-
MTFDMKNGPQAKPRAPRAALGLDRGPRARAGSSGIGGGDGAGAGRGRTSTGAAGTSGLGAGLTDKMRSPLLDADASGGGASQSLSIKSHAAPHDSTSQACALAGHPAHVSPAAAAAASAAAASVAVARASSLDCFLQAMQNVLLVHEPSVAAPPLLRLKCFRIWVGPLPVAKRRAGWRSLRRLAYACCARGHCARRSASGIGRPPHARRLGVCPPQEHCAGCERGRDKVRAVHQLPEFDVPCPVEPKAAGCRKHVLRGKLGLNFRDAVGHFANQTHRHEVEITGGDVAVPDMQKVLLAPAGSPASREGLDEQAHVIVQPPRCGCGLPLPPGQGRAQVRQGLQCKLGDYDAAWADAVVPNRLARRTAPSAVCLHVTALFGPTRLRAEACMQPA